MQASQKPRQPFPDEGYKNLDAVEKLRGNAKEASLAEVARSVVQDFYELGAAQLKLARLELGRDLRIIVSRSIGLSIAIPPLLLGYAFGMAALAHWLASYWHSLRALLAVAAVNLLLGGAGTIWAVLALKRSRILVRASAEVSAGADLVAKSLSPASGDDHE